MLRRRSPASPAGRSPARCRRSRAGRVPRPPGNPRRSDRSRHTAPAFRAWSAMKRRRCSAGVGQFAERVCQFEAADIQLEAFGEARVVGLCAATTRRETAGSRKRWSARRCRAAARSVPEKCGRTASPNRRPACGAMPIRAASAASNDASGATGSGAVASRSMPVNYAKASATVRRCQSARASALCPCQRNASLPAAACAARSSASHSAIRSR